MTRIMQSIGDKARSSGAGLGLVTIKRTTGYPTRTEVFLTDKGRAVAAQVFENLRRLSRS
jgi:DNA-binding MarR family transcriptional regulator